MIIGYCSIISISDSTDNTKCAKKKVKFFKYFTAVYTNGLPLLFTNIKLRFTFPGVRLWACVCACVCALTRLLMHLTAVSISHNLLGCWRDTHNVVICQSSTHTSMSVYLQWRKHSPIVPSYHLTLWLQCLMKVPCVCVCVQWQLTATTR